MLSQHFNRPGRFDTLLYVPPPDEFGRLQALQVFCWYNCAHVPLLLPYGRVRFLLELADTF
jgi:hypothetical protein